jgi:hypothetical protein
MRKPTAIAMLALFGSITVAQAGTPKAYNGVYGPEAQNRGLGWSARAKVRPVRDAFAQVYCACARVASTYWTYQMPPGSYLNLR